MQNVFNLSFLPTIEKVEAANLLAIKVESFDQDVTTDGSTFTLNNDVGATSSAFVRMNTGTRKVSAGPIGSLSDTAPNVGTVGLVLTDTDTVTVERVDSTAVKVMGEVWRYEGSIGGGNEFIVRDRVAVSLTGASQSMAISGVSDVDNVVPFVTGYTVNAATVSDWEDATIAAHMDDSGNLVVSRNNSGTAATVYVDVVEFTGSDWTVCHGYSSSHDGAEETVILSTDSDGQGGSTCDVGDWGTATIIEATMEGDSSETGITDVLALVRPGANTTSVVFDMMQDVGAQNDGSAWMHVLQNDNLVVNRASSADIAEGDGTYGTASWPSGASTTAAIDTLSLEWFTDTSGVGTAHMRGGLHARISEPEPLVYADGDAVVSTDYVDTVQANFAGEMTFAATPSGVVYEAGGTGIGAFVGYNDSGDFIVRAGNGASTAPTTAARIVVTASDYDFSSRTGTLRWNFYPATNSVDLSFDEGSNGSIEYATSTTAVAAWSSWAGTNAGNVGNSNANIAGSEITSGYDFNGTIDEVRFLQDGGGEAVQINHWTHRNGNTVGVEYGVIELSGLLAITDDVFVSATGTHAVETDIPTTDFYTGGAFVIKEMTSSRNITSITVNESGTVDGSTDLDNIKLFYDLDTTGADDYDCSSESYDGGETQFGATDTNGFSGADGASSFSGSVPISTTQTMCVYVVYDVLPGASDGDTVQLSIANPSVGVAASLSPSVGPSIPVTPADSTILRNAELTQSHYRWLNDDGVEGSATEVAAEDTSAIGFANGAINRLRMQVSAEGSTSSLPTTLRLEYATATAACAVVNDWTDVGATDGAWDMSDTAFYASDGLDSNDLTPANGGTTNENITHISTNGALKDINSTLASPLIFTPSNFLELEFAIEPTAFAQDGSTYCFRVTDQGTELRNYDIYPEGTVSADFEVTALDSASISVDVGTTAQYTGGTFMITRPSGSAENLTSLTITEVGTVDAQNNLDNIEIWYDEDSSLAYDCTSESFDGDEIQFGATDTDSFSSSDGSSTFTGSVSIGTNQTFCAYVVLDVGSGAVDGETIQIEISNPATDVVMPGFTVGPSTKVSPTGSTAITGPIPTQTHYHWRNDDGDETDTGATSVMGAEDTPIALVPKESTQRLRVQVSNEGTVSTAAANYRLEYGTKVLTCDTVGTWNQVGVGAAFATSASAFIADGNTIDLANAANGAMTDENTTFVGTGALRETSSESGAITLTGTQFTELEYSIEATAAAGDETEYCFRVTDSGTPLASYTTYPELTTRQKQDFFIQKGTATITGTSLTINAGSDYVAPSATSSAFVRITNSQLTGAGNDTGSDGQYADDVTAYISDQSDITTGFSVSRIGNTTNTRVDWEIIEFIGLPGTDNEIKVRDVGEVSMAATVFFATTSPVSTVVDDADVVVFITGQRNQSAAVTNYNDGLFTADWSASTNEPVFQRGDADPLAELSYAVVEFTGANWKIQRIEHSSYTSSGSTETEPLTAVTAVSQTFVHAQKRVGENISSIDEGGHKVWVSSMGYVSFELMSTADSPTEHVSVAWVVENTQKGNGAMKSQQTTGSIIGPGAEPQSSTYSIGDDVVIGNASIFATNYTEGTGTTYPRLHAAFNVASSTDFEVWQSDTNNDLYFQVEVVEWPVAETSMRQNYYRFYVDNDALDPTDPWPLGGSDLGENTSITGANEPLGEGERVRIRMSLLINNATLPQGVQSYKLQYGKRDTSCSAIGVWNDLGDDGSGSIWRGYTSTVADGTELATSSPAAGTLNISVSDVAGTYEDENNTAVNPYSVDLGEDVEYDWHVEHNGATQLSDYCFRMVQSDGSELDGYNNYPTLRTTGYTPVIGEWRWYDDATSTTPVSSMGEEGETPVNIVPGNEIKLRATAIEVEGAPGVNVKFKLQYSEQVDFDSGVYDVEASHLCSATSTWCYVDAAGVDNAVIDSAVLSDADSCVAGVGNGCGVHNEIATTTTTLSQDSLSHMEFEFAVKPQNPRVNAVYYFRLYDVTNDASVSASSSYPSLQVEGASLMFTLEGMDSGEVTEGITTDVTTTATSIMLGSLPFDTETEAAQRLTVDTNATQGYQILVVTDQDLTNLYGATIPVVSGTNASPLGWNSGGCSGLATGCFGYHAGDDLLQGGDVRFGADDTYAAFSTTPQEVMYHSVPVNDSHDMVYKIQITKEQPSGDYDNTITYIAVPVF